MKELLHDFELAGRRLVKAPVLAALVIAALALGIGVTTAVFTVVHAVVLRPLPFPSPDRLVAVWDTGIDGSRIGFSYPDFLAAQSRVRRRGIEHLAFHSMDRFTLGGEEAERVPGAWVSAGYFPALGLEPTLGRLFTPAEGDAPGAPVVLVGHELWQRRLGGDPGVVGRTLEINQVPLTIVGVLPPGFRGFDGEAELFVPLPLFDRLIPSMRALDVLNDGSLGWGRVLGRLAAGVGPEQARRELRSVAGDGIDLEDARENLVGDLRPQFLRLLGASSFVLLIACANVGHLLLTRAAGRDREMAVRAALGATRWRIVRHWLSEGLLLGLAGCAAGLLTAAWSLSLLPALIPLDIPAAIAVRIDAPVLLFALGISLLGSGLAAVAPALHAARPALAESLKQGGRGVTESRASRRLRALLVATDVALALVLLIGAGLMIRSLDRIRDFDPGFRKEGVLTLSFEPPNGLAGHERIRVKREILARAADLPGVGSATLTSHILFDPQRNLLLTLRAEGQPDVEPRLVQAFYVSSGYFHTLGIPLETGRDFLPADHRLPMRTAIVNRAFAERFFRGVRPLGRRIALTSEPVEVYEVVGVAGNVRTSVQPGVTQETPQVYLPSQGSPSWGFNLVIATRDVPRSARAREDAEELVSAVRRMIGEVDRNTAVSNVMWLERRVEDATTDTRFFTGLMGVFAGLALGLAVLGIYGLVVSTIQQQTRDIAVRRVMGAGGPEILRLILIRGMGPALLGIVLGLGAALALARTLSAVLFDVAPLDPATFLAVPLLFAVTALVACLLPAQTALEIEPMEALREDV